jgi:hypothetical protein
MFSASEAKRTHMPLTGCVTSPEVGAGPSHSSDDEQAAHTGVRQTSLRSVVRPEELL